MDSIKRKFSYPTVGLILDELAEENINITRVNFYRLEKRLNFPIAKRTTAKLQWRVYTREQVEEIKNKIREEYNLRIQKDNTPQLQLYKYQLKIPNDPIDYEDSCEAESKEKAAEIFTKKINALLKEDAWIATDLIQYIAEVED